MKYSIHSVITVFLLCFFVNSYANTEDRSIRLDKENHLLLAPKANNYVWYFNGRQIENTGNKLEVSEAGIYEVKMTDDSGITKTSSISLGVNAEGKIYRIILIGDSTVQAWGGGYYPQEGWGATLKYFFDDSVAVINRARSARSARSYYNEADWWPVTKEMIEPGDFVFIGFGINDAADTYDRFTEPFDTNVNTGYKYYLKRYIVETRERGGIPVIVTTVRRCSFNADGTVYDSWHGYPIASRQMAEEYNLPCIDLDQASIPLYESMGEDYIAHFIHNVYDPGEYPNYPDGKSDKVHFQESGCIEICKLVTDEIKKYPDNEDMNHLIQHIKPMYEVTTSTNFPDLAQITRTQSFPEGAPVTIKARFADTYDLLHWEDGDGNIMSKDNVYRFTMGSAPMSLTAIIDDDPVEDCNGVYNGGAYIDDCGVCVEGSTKKLPCSTELAEGTYKISLASSALCIEEKFTEITQEVCQPIDSQFWEVSKTGNIYKIKNHGSGSYIEAPDLTSLTNMVPGNNGTEWRIEKYAKDTFQIVPVGNLDLVLEIFSTREGKNLRLNTRIAGDRQRFVFWSRDPENCTGGYPCTNGVNNLKMNDIPFEMYTNQDGNIILELEQLPNKPYAIDVYNVLGKTVFHQDGITSQQFSFGENLEDNMYIIKVTEGYKSQSLKFLKY